MKKAFLFLVLAIFTLSCEKKSEEISFSEFIVGNWTAKESQTFTRLQIMNETYILEQQFGNDIITYPEKTYITDKIGSVDFIIFNDFGGLEGNARVRITWNLEYLDEMAWVRGENIAPLVFDRVIEL